MSHYETPLCWSTFFYSSVTSYAVINNVFAFQDRLPFYFHSYIHINNFGYFSIFYLFFICCLQTSRLLSPGYGVMGLNNLSIHDSRFRPQVLQCCLLETSGLVRSIQVPFHLALSDKNSRRAHDLHLMKKLSNLIHHRKSLNGENISSKLEILKQQQRFVKTWNL